MHLVQLNDVTDPAASLAAARAETKSLQEAEQRSEALYQKYGDEHQRLVRLQQSINTTIADLAAKLADATRRFCLRAAAGESFDGFGEQLIPLEAKKRFALSVLSYVAETAIPAVELEVLKHKLAWLQAKKALPEHSACLRRLGALCAVVKASTEFDPGLRLDVSQTQSAVEMQEAAQWQREIDSVQQELNSLSKTQGARA